MTDPHPLAISLSKETNMQDDASAEEAIEPAVQLNTTENEPTTEPESAPPMTAEAAAARKELLRLAMKAFRKRLKLTILDDESRLGRGPMSGGNKSSVIAITPPNQFPRDVWEELAEQGKIKRAGRGVYELTE
jgi:hypothetical protein